MQEVSELRVRDLKRRLARQHGYAAEELDRILDKKELIQTLAFEEEKVRLLHEADVKRAVAWKAVLASIVAVLGVFCWPLIRHAMEVAHVHWVVYTDRKTMEAKRCFELKATTAILGVLLMGILDVLQLWLTVTILLSWVTTPKWYFFPIPRLSLRPAALMGGQMSQSPMANYGINVGSMILTWGMRFLYGKIEQWTGKQLAAAHRQQRREARQWETDDDRAARKAARKQAKLEKQQQAAAAAAANNNRNRAPPPPPPAAWMEPVHSQQQPSQMQMPVAPASREHDEFLSQLDEQPSEHHNNMDDDDADNNNNNDITASQLDELD